jgi:predicted flavoprotein YhiN
MPTRHSDDLKRLLARWVAGDGKVATWCRHHEVPLRTAYRWYRSEWFRRLVKAYRRPMVDRAIGKMARDMSKAVETIDRLVERGETEGVKLAAARAMVSSVLNVRRYAELKAEIRRLEERIESLVGPSGRRG